ncbi:Hypothetical protein NTJ_05575 [Nesidiocoris tenuis]|uniref:Uncharacterized protein n=1 Tax=Nesidiocoris tenuis TaxID=355587 RepID=A0ABN7AMW1_9HEMI|nr:Hypothetical protein NTJ_05575 [Nesidiocoris tenuis]
MDEALLRGSHVGLRPEDLKKDWISKDVKDDDDDFKCTTGSQSTAFCDELILLLSSWWLIFLVFIILLITYLTYIMLRAICHIMQRTSRRLK